MKSTCFQAVFPATIFLLFTIPYLVLAVGAPAMNFSFMNHGVSAEILETLLFTIVQALMSAAVALIFGCLGAAGLLALQSRFPKWSPAVEAFVLLPNMAPILLLLLATLKAFPGLRGLFGVVVVHMFLNVGLISVAAAYLAREKLGRMSELAYLENSSRWRFFWRGALPYLKGDLGSLGLFVFTLCFSSFAIPIVLGGPRAATLEVLIYQSLRTKGDWGGALFLSGLQALAIFVFSFFLKKVDRPLAPNRATQVRLLAWRPGLLLALFPSLLLVWGLCDGLIAGCKQLLALSVLIAELPTLFLGSIVIGTGTGLLTAGLLLVIAFVYPQGFWRRALLGFAAPSTVLTGFALLVFWRAGGWATYVKLILGLSLIAVPSFYRLHWDNTLRALAQQRVVAATLGASPTCIFSAVLLPQLISDCLFLAGLASVWAWGDFALSSVVAEKTLSMAMVVQSLLDSYRLQIATVLVWIVALGGLLSFAIFTGAGRVLGAKSKA